MIDFMGIKIQKKSFPRFSNRKQIQEPVFTIFSCFQGQGHSTC